VVEVRLVRWKAILPLAAVLLATVPTSPDAQTRTWLLGALIESPEVVVPIATLDSRDDAGREWRVGLVGWTLQGDWAQRTSERRRRFLSLAVTPRNADYSNYVYRDGQVDDSASYRASSIRLATGIELERRNGVTGRYALIGDYRYVRDLAPTVESRWRRPFIGIEVSERWRRVTATESFGTRINGVDMGGLARVLFGSRTWSQLQLDAHAGRRLGRAFAQVDVAGFAGQGLDVVNAFLVGGSWHLADPRLASGHHFGEYRLDHAFTASGRMSARLAGTVEVGGRVSALAGTGTSRTGAGVEVRAITSGIVIDAGVAWAHGPNPTSQRRPVVYGQLTTAILQR
jgi:hypothetical protein